jgi:hypothetical protein
VTTSRDLHRRLDREHAEAQARDGPDVQGPDIARPQQWRQDAGVSGGQREAKLLLCELVERTSARGTRYLSGWLGKARLVAFAGEPDEEGHRTWSVYASEPGKRPSGDRP